MNIIEQLKNIYGDNNVTVITVGQKGETGPNVGMTATCAEKNKQVVVIRKGKSVGMTPVSE